MLQVYLSLWSNQGQGFTLQPANYLIRIFTPLKLCFADAIHHFKCAKIIQIWQNVGQQFCEILLFDVTFYP